MSEMDLLGTVDVSCPHCGVKFSVERKYLFRHARCEACGKNFIIGAKTTHKWSKGVCNNSQEVSVPWYKRFYSCIWTAAGESGFKFITLSVAKWLARIGYFIAGVLSVFSGLSPLIYRNVNCIQLLISFIVSIFCWFLAIILIRIWYELVVAIFRSSDDLHAIRSCQEGKKV